MPPSVLDTDRSDGYDSDPRVQLHNYYYTVLKRRWVVLAVMLATWILASIASFLQTPKYDASALVQIDWGKINLVEDVMIEDHRAGSTNLYATQEKILRSRVLARRVVEQLELWRHPLFASSDRETGDEASAIKNVTRAVASMLHVSQIRNTQLMEVGYLTPDPSLSAQLANTLIRQYILFNAEAETDLARDTSSFIRDQVEELRREILQKESFLREYSRKSEIVMAESRDDNIVLQRLQDLNHQLTAAEAERAAAEAHYRSVRSAQPGSLSEVRNSGAVRELKSKYAALKEEYARLSSKFKSDWPEVQRLETALQETRRSLDEEIRAESTKVVSAARVAYQTALERERLVREALQRQKEEVQNLQRMTADYEQVQVELENQRQMLQGLLRRRSETDLSADLGERQPVKVRVVEPAEAPDAPSSPNVPMNLLVGGALGLLLGVGLAFTLEYFDNSISTMEDLRRWVPLPYLGMIPRYERGALPSSGAARLLPAGGNGGRALPQGSRSSSKRTSYLPTLYDRSPSMNESRRILSERLRFLRGSLLLSTPGHAPKVVLVTSPDQNCGKTFISCNLSAALVQLNKTVLLVDSDLRNPNLHKVFRYRNRVGLTNVLTGQRPLHEGCIMRTDTPNLFLLMAGPKSPNPGELLDSPAMVEMLQSCARHFDFVLLDSAPLLPVFDTHTLSAKCDAVVLVTRAGVTSRQAVKTSVDLVGRVNGKITGVVLNDVDLHDCAQNYYYSSYSYEYGGYGDGSESRAPRA